MIKRTLIAAGGLGLLAVVLFGRDVFSYFSTSYQRVTNAVENRVPTDFQIDRARDMVTNLEPEIRNAMHVIAKEEVELEKLNGQIDTAQEKIETDKSHILRLQADLRSNREVFRYAGRNYTPEHVREDLSRRFGRFKVADDTVANLSSMRDAREKNLDAARQKLSAMINARQKLAVEVENLEAKRKLVEVAQATSEYSFDDTQLNRAKELISDIRTRLEVQAKLANADVNVEVTIPLEEENSADITEQVAEYFGLGGPSESEFAKASYSKPSLD
jgi:chromosome segregation ATPase